MNNLYKILKPRGKLYFSVPIGPQRMEFNGHRIFSIRYLLNLIDGKYEIDNFSYVNDKGIFYENVSLTSQNIDSNCECRYGCGIFELTKI